ncbi:hypothetical protein GCM10023196_066270 [Actinoallomurus vinaceus]|uniref:Uncharacterized protein n=1 Tax=Actinoallomurus vinaceus TaxID=1080074 RepID=A0ABP8UHS4_9ACTN
MTMTATEDPVARRVRESIAAFYDAIDRFGLSAVTPACELIQLDRLVRRYPQAASKSLELYRPEQSQEQEDP